jgi:hypothetical protein
LKVRDLLVGIATFLVVAAVIMHLAAKNRFAAVWPVQDVTTRSTAVGASYQDPTALEQRDDVTLVRRRSVAPLSTAGPDTDSLLVSTSTLAPDGTVLARARFLVAQRRVTGTAVDSWINTQRKASFNSSGDSVERQQPLRAVEGVLARFPRGTRPDTHRRWDPETGRAGKAVFERRARLADADVLVFRQRQAPAADADTGTSVASETLLWVRPEVGAVVKTSTHVVVRRASSGQVTLDARFVDDAASVRRASSQVDRAVARSHVVGTVVPAGVLAIGVIAALAAVLEARTGWLGGHPRRRPRGGS